MGQHARGLPAVGIEADDQTVGTVASDYGLGVVFGRGGPPDLLASVLQRSPDPAFALHALPRTLTPEQPSPRASLLPAALIPALRVELGP